MNTKRTPFSLVQVLEVRKEEEEEGGDSRVWADLKLPMEAVCWLDLSCNLGPLLLIFPLLLLI